MRICEDRHFLKVFKLFQKNNTLARDVFGSRDNSKCIDIDLGILYELEAVKEKTELFVRFARMKKWIK